MQNNVSIYEGVGCDDDVFLGPSLVFTNVSHPWSHVSRKHSYEVTTVARGVSIGAECHDRLRDVLPINGATL